MEKWREFEDDLFKAGFSLEPRRNVRCQICKTKLQVNRKKYCFVCDQNIEKEMRRLAGTLRSMAVNVLKMRYREAMEKQPQKEGGV